MKNVLITGSSGLIGSGLVREFIAQGYRVFGLDLKAPEYAYDEFTFLKCNIAKEAEVQKCLKKIPEIHVLINNGAKANPQNKKLHQLSLNEWHETLASNLDSVFLLSKHAIPKLKKSQGCIINISSTRHLMSEPDTEIYSASKGAIRSLTRALSISLGPDIRVNCVSPGWIHDPKEKLKKKDHQQHPVGRVGMPIDIASACVFLASEKSGFITGSDFVIDGGMTSKMIYED